MRLFVAFFLFLIVFVVINVAFLDNLRRIWSISYPFVLLVINLDLLILFTVFTIFFRKFIKTYLTGQKKPLRKKLSTSLILYISLPLLFLNLATAIILLQSTKTFISGQLKEVAKKSEELISSMQEKERQELKEKKELFKKLIESGREGELKSFKDIKEANKVEDCREELTEVYAVLCVEGYRILLERKREEALIIRDIRSASEELRSLVKARDIVGGIYVYFLVLAGFISFLSAVWLGNLFARHISLPLERLSQKAKEIAKGSFDVQVEVPKTGDEVEELAKSFSVMKEELKKLYERLSREKNMLLTLFEALPVGVLFKSIDGETFHNKAYMELSNKANVKVSTVKLPAGEVVIYEDLEPIILAERFKTWQMAVKRIAHEIKNPLTPISLNLERLLRWAEKSSLKAEDIRGAVEIMLEEVERIRRKIDQFRSLSIEIKPDFSRLDLGQLLRNIGRLYSQLEINVSGSLEVMGDERLLRDMFYNLLNNSLEWGAKRVWIELHKDRIVYKDDGTGIEEGKEELIFMPYHSENPKGMGLGLAIVKHISELHGWKVKAYPSKEGFHMEVELSPR